jgi:hypothetical protein
VNPPSTVCLIIDRLPAHLVGAYGNTWIRTPALDALAAESLLLEFATFDSPDLESLYRSYWHGLHAAVPQEAVQATADLPSLLRGQGVRSLLITDEPALLRVPSTGSFDELLQIQAPDEPQTADDVESTHLGRFFAAAAEVTLANKAPSLVWLHCQGLAGPWDAPLELRNFYADEDDPEPPAVVVPPHLRLPADHDPDERLGFAQAASGQVTALDECLGEWLGAVDAWLRARGALLIVMGACGYPLGEHLQIGPGDNALYEELIHVPLLIRFPDSAVPLRSRAFAQPGDIFATLLDWFGVTPLPLPASPLLSSSLLPLRTNPEQPLRDRAVCVGASGEWSIRTPAWYLRHPKCEDDAIVSELYVKPDDRFEQNDVARRCADIVEGLTAAGEEVLHAAAQPHGTMSTPVAPLSPELVLGID